MCLGDGGAMLDRMVARSVTVTAACVPIIPVIIAMMIARQVKGIAVKM